MYKVNDIFYQDADYINKARFCNANNLLIAEIEPDEKGRRFQIQEIPKPTQEQLNSQRIAELKQLLENTDYKAIKYAEGLISASDYAEIKAQRQTWRNEISQLGG